uniref:Coiled-coil domain containing 90B n=1 Tax=Ornithorhynchus anatinus TaxID=9258 RepID=A0A6I8NID1_ORNAN
MMAAGSGASSPLNPRPCGEATPLPVPSTRPHSLSCPSRSGQTPESSSGLRRLGIPPEDGGESKIPRSPTVDRPPPLRESGRGLAATAPLKSYDMRQVDITPLEQRKLTFDTHALVRDLETHGFEKVQAETIVSALTALSNVSLDTIYKEMVTQAQQEITLQQLMAHLDSIRKDMVILEKSEFANLRAENEKMKIELDQVKRQLINETSRIRADNKLDINLERSRVTDLFTDQEKKLMEATTEFTKKDTRTKSVISETSNKIDTEIASLKTLMESNKLETIRYLAASVFTCLAIALGFYRFWK